MCHEKRFKLALVINVLCWVVGVVVTVLNVAPGVVVPWYWLALREPVAAAVYAAHTLVLAVWWFSAPGGTAFRVGEQIGDARGYARGRAEGVADLGGTVVPLQPRRSLLS